MSFDNPRVLFALTGLVPIGIMCIVHYHTYRAALGALSPSYIAGLPGDLRRRYVLSALFFALFLAGMIIALAGPRWGSRLAPEFRRGADVVLALDLSRSMGVRDMPDTSGEGDLYRGEASRLDRAAAIARFLVSTAGLDEGGLRFAAAIGKGSGVLALPLTEDAEALLSFLESLSPQAMTGTGTNLETLIDAASAAFQTNFPTRRRMVLFSDGESLSGSIQNALDRAVKEDIRITVVGLGSAAGGPVPLDGAFLLREDGLPVISALREDVLRNAAEYTGGIYIDGSRTGAAASLSDHIRDIASEGFSTSFKREPRSRWYVFVIAALAALGISKLLEKEMGVKKA